MGQTLKIAQGFDRSWGPSVLRDSDGNPTPYPPEAEFDAVVWRGGGELVLFAPLAQWVDSEAATWKLSVAATQTATGIDVGLYRFQVGLTSGGVRSLVFDGHLEVIEAPGDGTLRVPYVTGAELAYWYDQIGTLQTIRGGDATFLTQRAEASDEFDRLLIVAYNENGRPVLRRRDTRDPILGTFDVPDPAAVIPTTGEFTAIVQGGGVVADRNTKEIVAKMALARVLDRQEVMGNSNPYRQQAASFQAEAERLWRSFAVRVDTSDSLDGVVDLLVGRDIILIPAGSAP